MEIRKVTEDFAVECFKNGIDCSQIVMGYASNKLGINPNEALRLSAAFGGGMWQGRTFCGFWWRHVARQDVWLCCGGVNGLGL